MKPREKPENSRIDKARRPEDLKAGRSENQSDKDGCTAAVNSHRKDSEEGYSERIRLCTYVALTRCNMFRVA